MMFILRSDHYVDTPADVMVFSTSTKAHNVCDRVNGAVKNHFPNWFTCAKRDCIANTKLGSVIILKSQNPIMTPAREKPHQLIIAGVCVYSPAHPAVSSQQLQPAIQAVFHWFWMQDQYASLGMSLIMSSKNFHLNSAIQDHQEQWEIARSARIKEKGAPNNLKDRVIYLHSLESRYLAPIQQERSDVPFQKVRIVNPLFPRLES